MKLTFIAIAMATSLATPARADEYLHNAIGDILTLAERENTTPFYWFMGFTDAMFFVCEKEKQNFSKGLNSEETTKLVIKELRKLHTRGVFFNKPTVEINPVTQIEPEIIKFVCGKPYFLLPR